VSSADGCQAAYVARRAREGVARAGGRAVVADQTGCTSQPYRSATSSGSSDPAKFIGEEVKLSEADREEGLGISWERGD
jgi:hypothetical protein